jgi:aminopeptidase N
VTDFFRAHEVSHQWWGHRVGWKSYHDQWMSEGFAQYSGNLYVHMRQNLKEYLIRIREDRRQLLQKDFRGRTYESLGPVWLGERLLNSSESPEAYWTVIYNKGGLILHMLRMMLFDPGNAQNPEHRFMAMMQEFTRSYDNKPASTEDFKSVAEKYMIPAMNIEGNGKLDWFFRQYVYGTGIPQYSFRYSAQPAPDGKYKITATIAQSGVPDGWKDILPIYIHQGNNVALLGWTRATQKENKVEFTLPFNPTKISLNHYEDVLADIK